MRRRFLRSRFRLNLEELEARNLLSVAGPEAFTAAPAGTFARAAITNPNVVGYTPSQIQHAYGFDQIPSLSGNYNSAGSGQTIAIVDVADDPNILGDANTFSKQFGLPAFNSGSGAPTLTRVNENGSATGPFPAVDRSGSWEGEESLDVEWAHAIAPAANILLVEANSTYLSDLSTAINTARNGKGLPSGTPLPTAVSMSWGGGEFNGISSYDQYLTTPAGHPGITFTAATLDNGSYYHGFYTAYWPAVSPNALAVGGTTLQLDTSGNSLSESGWSSSGGGLSKYEGEPTYQKGVVSSTITTSKRANPDVAYDADYNTGFAVYDTISYNGQTGWFQAGGTSAGTPQWAALVVIANQQRKAQGLSALDGPSQTLPALYQMAGGTSASTYFNDITTGSNGYAAGTGYDLVTGVGSPHAAQVVQALVSVTGSGTSVVITAPTPPAGITSVLNVSPALVLLTPQTPTALTAPTLTAEGAQSMTPGEQSAPAVAGMPRAQPTAGGQIIVALPPVSRTAGVVLVGESDRLSGATGTPVTVAAGVYRLRVAGVDVLSGGGAEGETSLTELTPVEEGVPEEGVAPSRTNPAPTDAPDAPFAPVLPEAESEPAAGLAGFRADPELPASLPGGESVRALDGAVVAAALLLGGTWILPKPAAGRLAAETGSQSRIGPTARGGR